MAFELYEYRIFTKFQTRQQSCRFHLSLDNLSGAIPWETARQITKNLNADTLFLSLFAQLISEHAGIVGTICRRVFPVGGNTARVHLPGGGLQGLWLGRMAENFISANCRWIPADGEVSQNTMRIGPIGNGAITNSDYYSLFRLAFNAWVGDALTPRITIGGDVFHLSLVDKDGFSQPAAAAALNWPPARQINRRWVP
jgi:hypothetical protein